MPEITTRLGPLRLTWDIEYTSDGANIIEVFPTLIGMSHDAYWPESKPLPQWTKNRSTQSPWMILWEFIDEDERKCFRPSDDLCREAIERERADLRREDAERLAER